MAPLGENDDDQQDNDQDDEIDINEDFSFQFDINEEEVSVNEEMTVDNNTLITEVVSLAPIEKPEEDNQMESDSKENDAKSDENTDSKYDKSDLNIDKSDLNDDNVTTLPEIPSSGINTEKSKLSEDIIKGLREEAQRLAVGDISREDLENLGKELQNAMKTLFGHSKPKNDEIVNVDTKSNFCL